MDVYELVFDLLQAQKVKIKTVYKGLRCYFIVTQILLNHHVNCLKSYFYFFLYCIATQIPPHLYNLRIGVGWTNFGVCW